MSHKNKSKHLDEDYEADSSTDDAPKTEPKKRSRGQIPNSWPDIFAQIKLVVYCDTNEANEGSILTIRHANPDFFSTFGHPETEIGESMDLNFESLLGQASSYATFSTLKNSLVSKISTCEYINLYRLDGVALSTHATLLPLSSDHYESLRPQNLETKVHWGVITIRSASVVGNARCFGFGLGLEKVLHDAKLAAIEKVLASAKQDPQDISKDTKKSRKSTKKK